MPRPLRLKPIPAGENRWLLDIPAALSETGSRQRLYFRDLNAAKLKASELRATQHNLRRESEDFPEILRIDVLKAIELLGSVDPKATLFDAAKLYVASYQEKSRSVTFAELFDLYLELKSQRSEVYRKELLITKNRLSMFHEVRVCDLESAKLETALAKIPPASRNAMMRYLRAVFNVGIRRGYLRTNPITALEFIHRPRKEVEVLPPEQFEQMLNAALISDLALLHYLIVCGFAGVRPKGEASRLEWRDYNWTEGKLEVRPEVTKTNQRRYVELEPNSQVWLETYRVRGGNVTGLMVPYTAKELRTHRENNRRAAHINHWPNSVLRHSFASYWCGLHDNVDRLLFMLGHSSLEMLRRHYRRAVPTEQAKKYFSILPPASAENVVPFASAF
jgi:integrase